MRSNYNAALTDAIDRDMRDQERLAHIADLVTNLLDALIPDAEALEHPDARWCPGDLIDSLQGELTSIRHELARVSSGPVVICEA